MPYAFELETKDGTVILDIALTDFRQGEDDEIFDLEWTAVSGVLVTPHARIHLSDRTIQEHVGENFDDIQEAGYAWAREEIKNHKD